MRSSIYQLTVRSLIAFFMVLAPIFASAEFVPASEETVVCGASDPDADSDGLCDALESELGTDPNLKDTDGDGLEDGDEYNNRKTDPTLADTDGDGLNDGDEIERGTDPLDTDTDDDGRTDGQEVNTDLTDPTLADEDNDGLNDGEEFNNGTDPKDSDSDDDGLNDGDEVKQYGTNPLSDADFDEDGLKDSEEVLEYGTEPTDSDTDDDGLNDGEEVNTYGTDPTVADTDSDTINDYDEINVHGTDPTLSDTDGDGVNDYDEIFVYDTDPNDKDSDDDGVEDGTEINDYESDPNLADTDGDGCNDGQEVAQNSNILVADSDVDGDGYKKCDGDCNDNDATINPITVWYADADGDTYGTDTDTKTQCTQPTGYVRVSGDCNDADATINPTTVWYQDTDGDGYGNSSVSLTQCAAPTGYVRNADDCDDTKSTINPATKWYADVDGDGYGSDAVTKTQCSQPQGYILTAGDCDDAQEALNPSTVWYADADGDGFGLETDKKTQCSKPTGYVMVAGDCNDADANAKPTTKWYKDQDGDGFGDAASTTESCSKPKGFVANSTDCNDQDGAVYPGAPTLPDGKDNNCDGTIDKLPQTITIVAIGGKIFGDAPFEVTATSSAGLTASLSVTGPATVAGNVVTITGAGEIVISAVQAGNNGYSGAGVSATVQVAKANQTVTLTALENVNFEVGSIEVTAASSSGLPVTYAVQGNAELEGNTIKFTGAGELTVTASTGDNSNYNVATPASQTICVNPALPVITAGSNGKSLSTALVAGASYTWFKDGVDLPESGAEIANTDNGVFSVLVDVGGCVRLSEEINVTVTGIRDAYLSSVVLYPNPAADRISLQSLEEVFSSSKTVHISDVSGSLVREHLLAASESSIELTGLPPGVYYLRVFDERARKDFRFIKQ